VEVVLALGIAAFALIAIVGLLPVGLKLAQESDEESRAINLISQITTDRRVSKEAEPSETFLLPALSGTAEASNVFGVSEDGRYLGTDYANSRYRVNYILTPPSEDRGDPWRLWMRVSWPAQSANASGSVETLVTIPQS
jgi:type II secretory pathway pseudopilin PulG